MPRTRSRAKTASPPSPPEAAAAATGSPQRTPVPSPSTSLRLGIGPASPHDDSAGSLDLKKPVTVPPRHSLRLAGAALRLGLGPASPDDDDDVGAGSPNLSPPAAAPLRRSLRLAGAAAGSPNTPSARDGSSSGSGSGSGSGAGEKRAGRSRARVSGSWLATTVSPRTGNSSSYGGGSGADRALASGDGSGGSDPFTTLRSLSRIGKRRMEAGGDVGSGSSRRGQVHDEMLHRDVGSPTKRCKTILVGGVQTVYVSDTDSDSDEDCKMLGSSWIKPSPVAVNMDRTEKGDVDDPANASNGESLQTHDLLRTANGGVVEELAYPSGSPSSFEAKVSAEEVKVKEKLVSGNNNSRADANVGSAVGTSSSKFNPDSKGKGKMVVEDSLSSLSSSEDEPDFDPVDNKETQLNSGSVSASMESLRRRSAKERAIRLAPKFAFFKADKDEHSEDDEEEELQADPDAQDWPGPFATAARIYEEREAKLRARELNSSKVGKSANRVIVWSPSKDRKNPARAQAPSLTSVCLNTLAEHSECIESLGGIPEELKNKLLKILCHSRKMKTHLLHQLLCDSPTELHLSECSWLSEDDFEKTFEKCSTESLQDLQLDISGRCMPDYILPSTLAKVPNCMPLLRKISLKGNYRLSDNGLGTIISAAPSLSSLNLCECSLLTSSGIDILANKLHSVLRELYIDECTNVDAMAILPALQKINHLEVLSMSGIQSVCDKFVKELIAVHGSNLKELAFAGCLELTSSSIKTIGEYCQELTSLDLRNLDRLRDSAMRHLRGCRLIRKLKLQRNAFSDEAVSQYLEKSGGCLTELMLNNVKKVGDLTALAISRKCSVLLEALDLSFCRELTDEALGLIVDSCPSLRILKLFGCTQVTDLFLKGHSNKSVKIVGIEGSILVQMDNR
ncbi:DNA repair protein RAD7-like [Miscanthus floridulus]|uniref:DNA repair protein RAD7-like n=1 Tax=Miscanthus floridulus TaxID=154761 RepID=UPI00345B2057